MDYVGIATLVAATCTGIATIVASIISLRVAFATHAVVNSRYDALVKKLGLAEVARDTAVTEIAVRDDRIIQKGQP